MLLVSDVLYMRDIVKTYLRWWTHFLAALISLYSRIESD
jgi:hypothetical protein